jgi:hypothetical protein
LNTLPSDFPITLVTEGRRQDPLCLGCPRNPEYNSGYPVWGLCVEKPKSPENEEQRILRCLTEAFGKRADQFTVGDFRDGEKWADAYIAITHLKDMDPEALEGTRKWIVDTIEGDSLE